MKKNNRIKEWYSNEIKIKDMIIQRHKEYDQVLQKELTLAKNIIKNPKLFKKAFMEMNFNSVDLYKIRSGAIDPLRESLDHETKNILFQKWILKERWNNKIKIKPRELLSPQPPSSKHIPYIAQTMKVGNRSRATRISPNHPNTFSKSKRNDLEPLVKKNHSIFPSQKGYKPSLDMGTIKVSFNFADVSQL